MKQWAVLIKLDDNVADVIMVCDGIAEAESEARKMSETFPKLTYAVAEILNEFQGGKFRSMT